MHVPELLDPFALRAHIEVVKPFLPDVLRNASEKSSLPRITFAFLLGQYSSRKTNFDRLHYSRWILQLRFADQKVDVLRHNHIAHDDKLITSTRSFEDG